MKTPPDRPRKRHLELHRWLGAGATVLLFALSFTGTLTVLMPELLRWERSASWPADGASAPSIAAAVEAAGVLEPPEGAEHLSIAPAGEQPWVEVFARDPEGRRTIRVFTRGPTGELATDEGPSRLAPLRHLHTRLLAPRPFAQAGRILVGLAGLVLLSLIGSGLVMHGGLRALFKRPTGRANSRARWTALHRWAGLIALPFSATIAATGAFLGLTTLLLLAGAAVEFEGDGEATRVALGDALGRTASPEPEGKTGPDPAVIDTRIAEATATEPTPLVLRSVELDHPGDAQGTLTLVRRDQSYTLLRDQRLDTFRIADAEPLSSTRVRALSPAAQTLLATSTLHFGDAWGRASRLAYAGLGALLTVSMLWGLALWRVRAPASAAARGSLLTCRSLVVASVLFAAVGLGWRHDALAGSTGEALLVGLWGLTAALLWWLARREHALRPGADASAPLVLAVALGGLVLVDLARAPLAGRPAGVWAVTAVLIVGAALAAALHRRGAGPRSPELAPPDRARS